MDKWNLIYHGYEYASILNLVFKILFIRAFIKGKKPNMPSKYDARTNLVLEVLLGVNAPVKFQNVSESAPLLSLIWIDILCQYFPSKTPNILPLTRKRLKFFTL